MVAAPGERAALLRRFINEPRFAIENLFQIRNPKARSTALIRYNEAQVLLQAEIEWFRSRNLPVRLWICKSRRAGMSTVCEANLFHDTIFNPGTRSLIVANMSKPAENILDMCRVFWLNLPPSLRPELGREFQNRPARDRMSFEQIDSHMMVATAKSLDQYLGFGFNNVHGTEVARWERGSDLMTAIYPTLDDSPRSMFFGESTPLGQGNFFYEQCMLAFESQGRHGGEHGGFRLLFIPWHVLRKSYSTPFPSNGERVAFSKNLDDSQKELVKRFDVSLEQLNWRRGMLAGPPFNGDDELFDQEYPSDLETAFLATGRTVLSRAALKWLVAHKREPEWEGDIYCGETSRENRHLADYDLVRRPVILTEGNARALIAGGGQRFDCTNNDGDYRPLRLWRKPVKGDRLILACDVGGGNPSTKNGGDYSTMAAVAHNVFGADEVIATWKAHIIPVNFAVLASAFAWWLRGLAGDESPPLLVPEWNGTGVPMNMHIDNKKLYAPHFRYFNPGVHGTPASNHVGWESNSKTKRMGIGFMEKAIEEHRIDIPDERMIVELSMFKEFMGSDGEQDFGGEGSHDDMVAPLYIACSCIALGKMAGNPAPQRVMSDMPSIAEDDGEPFDRSGDARGMYAEVDDSEDYEGSGGLMDWE